MNKIYRTVYNQSTQTWTAVAEIASAHGKSASSRSGVVGGAAGTRFAYTLVASAVLLMSGQAMAASISAGTGTNSIVIQGASSTATAVGDDSLAAGTNAAASGKSALAIGTNSTATGENATAYGNMAKATANNATAFGSLSQATAQSATAVGDGAQATAGQTTAVGVGTAASSAGATAVGHTSQATADHTTALGSVAKATGNYATAVGANVTAGGLNSITIGRSNNVTGDYTTVIGSGNLPKDGKGLDAAGGIVDVTAAGSITATRSSIIGMSNQIAVSSVTGTSTPTAAAPTDVQIQGNSNIVNRGRAYVFGSNNTINTNSTNMELESVVAVGYQNTVSGNNSLAVGRANTVSGGSALAVGSSSKALGTDGIALGNRAYANAGENAIALGGLTHAGTWGTAVGARARAQGDQSIAMGANSAAKNERSFSIGSYSYSGANGGIAFGYNSLVADGAQSSTAIGAGSVVSGQYSGVWNASLSSGQPQVMLDANRSFVGGSNSYAIGNKNIIGSTSSDSFVLGNNVKLGASAASLSIANVAGADATSNTSTRTNTLTYTNTTPVTGAVALGSDTSVTVNNGVALGKSSAATVDKGVTGFSPLGATVANNSTWQATDAAVSVGNGTTVTRQITSVAAGAQDTDAVNVAQLKAATTHYYSVNSTKTAAGDNYNNDGATGQNSMAAGITTSATGTDAVAVGSTVTASGDQSLAVGNNIQATHLGATAVGNNSRAIADGAQAFGQSSQATAKDSAAMGRYARATAERTTAVGVGNLASGVSSFAGGDKSTAAGAQSIAIGLNANAATENSIAIGNTATANGGAGAIAVGKGTTATGTSAVVMGTDGSGTAQSVVVIGNASEATADNAVTIGVKANATGTGNIAIGENAGEAHTSNSQGSNTVLIGVKAGSQSTNNQAQIAVGWQAGQGTLGEYNLASGYQAGQFVNGANNVAFGKGAGSGTSTAQRLTASNTVSIGTSAQASKDNAIAIGNGAQANAVNTISIGTGNVVSGANSGALGDPSYITGSGTYTIGNDNGTAAAPIAANNAGAFGNNNLMTAAAENSRLVGNYNHITTANTYVLGSGINSDTAGNTLGTTVANSVYLGNDSTVTAAAGANALHDSIAAGTTTTGGATGTVSNATVNGITYSGFAGQTAAGAVSVGASGTERRIQNVAAGEISATSTDAINGSQLYQVANRLASSATHYYSVNDNGVQGNNYNNDGATADGALAAGVGASATAYRAVAVGKEAAATNIEAVAIGTQAAASNTATVAISQNAKASGISSIAIGLNTEASGNNSFVMGSGSTATAANRIAKASGNQSVAIGYQTQALGLGGTAIGSNATAAEVNYATAIGSNATAAAATSLAVGSSATANGASSVAIGRVSQTYTGNDIAIGSNAKAGINGGTTSTNAIAIGLNTTAAHTQAIAIGTGATTGVDHGVALGSGAMANVAAGAVGADPLGAATTIANSTWTATRGAVSLGNGTTVTRQITSVAAGTNDTDAVNVAQLKVAGFELTTSASNGTATGTTVEKVQNGERLTLDAGSGITLAQNANTITISTNAQALAESAQLPVVYTNANGDKLYKHTDGNFYTQPNGAGTQVAAGDVITSMQNADGSTTNPTRLTNLASTLPATDQTTAAQAAPTLTTAQQSNAATIGDVLNAGWNLQGNGAAVDFVKPYDTVNFVNGTGTTASVTGGGTASQVTFNVNTTTLTAGTDGKVTAGTTTGNSYATAADVASAINNSGFIATSGGNASGTSQQLVKPGDKLTLAAGDGLTVTQSGSTFTYALNSQSVVQDAQLPVVYTDASGNKLYKHTDGNFYTQPNGAGTQVAAGDVIASMQNAAGSTTTPTKLTNVANGTVSSTSKDAVNGSQLHGVSNSISKVLGGNATVNADGTVSMTNIGGTGANTVHDAIQAINNTAVQAKTTVTAGDNITVTAGKNADGSTNYTVATAKDVTFDTVNVGGVKIDGNSNKISGLAAGDVSANSTDAVNGSQLYATNQNVANNAANIAKGLNFGGDSGNNFNRQLGSTVNVVGGATGKLTDNNIGVVSNGSDTLTVKLAKDIDLGSDGSVKVGNTTVNNQGVSITGGPSMTQSGIDAGGQQISNVAAGTNGTDAVNLNQLNQAINNVNVSYSGLPKRVDQLERRVNDVDRDASAGVAQAIATAGLPQAYLPGKNMVAIGGGAYRGATGYAIGFSTISDNGNWIIKATGSGNSRGNFGASIGAGYQW